jgi:crotonobetainyl-CoA:carnitine CoA-transferase CaiB-like acyl-CoA transferase
MTDGTVPPQGDGLRDGHNGSGGADAKSRRAATDGPPRNAGADPAHEGGPLKGLRVIDAGVLFAGPVIGTLLADFGADVVKVEHPRGDALRTLGWQKNGVSLWWAFVSRNKRFVSLSFSTPEGAQLLKELVATADVLIESFRPGTMEKWGLGPEVLHAINPQLVIVRTSGFGQTGPYSPRPGFGTVAESISGFAHINGHPDGPPTLPPFALGDGVASLFGTFATMFALYHRDTHHAPGQVIDLAIYEPLFWLLGPQSIVYDQLGIVQGRTGSSTEWTAPRNAYRASDGRWLGLSASSQSIAERVMRLIGHPEVAKEPWFADHTGRVEHQAELDVLIGGWIASHTSAEVTAAFEAAEAVVGPIYSIADIFEDVQYRARETITSVEDPKLGTVWVQNAVPRLVDTPGSVRHLGGDLGADNRQVLGVELGHTDAELAEWQRRGAIGGPPLAHDDDDTAAQPIATASSPGDTVEGNA